MENNENNEKLLELADNVSLKSSDNLIEDECINQVHICNPILIAEDNPNILKKYETILSK